MWIELQHDIDRLIAKDKLPLITNLEHVHMNDCTVNKKGDGRCNCHGTFKIVISNRD